MIVKIKNFNLQTIANSGQLFRMNEIDDDLYESVAFNKYLTIKKYQKMNLSLVIVRVNLKKFFMTILIYQQIIVNIKRLLKIMMCF